MVVYSDDRRENFAKPVFNPKKGRKSRDTVSLESAEGRQYCKGILWTEEFFFILELFELDESDVKKLKISLNKNLLQLLRYI